MSSNESLPEEVETEEGTESYSSNFEETQWDNSSKTGLVTRSNDYDVDSQLSALYSSDFVSTARTSTPKPTYSAHTPRPRPKPRTSINTSLTRSYSDDFESVAQTARTNGAGTPTLLDVQTARSGYSITFTDDVGKYSRTPRRAVRARSLEILTARSAASLGYSDDFESLSRTARTPRLSARYSTDTFASYTGSFETDSDEESSEARTVGSRSETTDDTIRSEGTSNDDAVTVTERSFSESEDSYTYSTTESDTAYTETPQMRQIADSARRQFILQKLNVLRDVTVKQKPVAAPRQTLHKNMGTFCRKKIRMLKKKLNGDDDQLRTHTEDIKTPRYHLKEEDEMSVESLGINPSVINRLKTENALGRMKKMASEEVHVPSECPSCIGQVTDMALREFAAKKKTIVQTKEFDERLSNNQYKYGDPVALVGDGVKELPSFQDENSEIFKRLLRPWSFKIWGSKILKDEEEKAEKERTTINEEILGHNQLKATVKPSLLCPYLTEFDDKSKTSVSTSKFKPRNMYSPLFDDGNGSSKLIGKQKSEDGVFDILCDKMENYEIESERFSPRRPDNCYYPEGEVWDEIRYELEGSDGTARVPAIALYEKVPIGTDIPTDRAEFWKHYFAPLKSCSWFPKSS